MHLSSSLQCNQEKLLELWSIFSPPVTCCEHWKPGAQPEDSPLQANDCFQKSTTCHSQCCSCWGSHGRCFLELYFTGYMVHPWILYIEMCISSFDFNIFLKDFYGNSLLVFHYEFPISITAVLVHFQVMLHCMDQLTFEWYFVMIFVHFYL